MLDVFCYLPETLRIRLVSRYYIWCLTQRAAGIAIPPGTVIDVSDECEGEFDVHWPVGCNTQGTEDEPIDIDQDGNDGNENIMSEPSLLALQHTGKARIERSDALANAYQLEERSRKRLWVPAACDTASKGMIILSIRLENHRQLRTQILEISGPPQRMNRSLYSLWPKRRIWSLQGALVRVRLE